MIVYWCAYSENDTISQFKFNEPRPVLTCINETYTDLPPAENFKMCPAHRDYFKNVLTPRWISKLLLLNRGLSNRGLN